MKRHAFLLVLPLLLTAFMYAEEPTFDAKAAERFANLALACVHQEYPNKIAHVLNSDKDVHPPRELTPAFYGCFDWHSSVHGHWLLVRLLRTFPNSSFEKAARSALAESLTDKRVAAEAAYIIGKGRESFERPYGLAWLLQLSTELHEWDDPQARAWAKTIEPLEGAAVGRLTTWLPKLSHPVRSGEHSQSAFALGLMLDYARSRHNAAFEKLIASRISDFYLGDRHCAIDYEPSGEDFLSPCLAEADAVRRVLTPVEYAAWLGSFLPDIPRDGSASWLEPGVVTDPGDGKLAHLDGLNLSRAWMLEGIASELPAGDPRIGSLLAASRRHRDSGIAGVTGAHYEGGHWLGSFAVYLVTHRGVGAK